MFNKTCERAERVDRTYLAISPSENTVKLRNKRIDTRYRALEGTNFPVQKIYKDPKTGRPMPEWDTFIDMAMPIYIRNHQIEWHAEIYKTPVAEIFRVIRLYRFIQSLDYDIPDAEEMDRDGQPIDLDDRDRTQKRPVEWVGPGVRKEKQNLTPPSSSERAKGAQKATPHSVSYIDNSSGGLNKTSPTGPVQTNSWANVAADPNAQSTIQQRNKPSGYQNQKSYNQQTQQSRGGGWNRDNRGGRGNGANGGQWGRGGGQNSGRGQSNFHRGGRGNQHGGHWGGNDRNFNDNQKSGQNWGQYNKFAGNMNQQAQNTTNDGGKQPKELKIPENGKLAGLEKEATLPAKLILDIDEEQPAPVAELLALANEGTTQAKKPSLIQVAKQMDEKNKYDFAGFIRNRDRGKQASKLDIVPEEKDSAQCISDNERTTWNKPDSQLVQEPWPQDWEILKPGEWKFENIKEIPTREGWDYQQPNTPWWVRCQDWLGLKGK